MKTLQNLSLIFFVALFAISCVQDDDFGIPEVNEVEPDIEADLSIQDVIDFYDGFEPVIIEGGPDSETALFIEGYVVSSDETGNYFKQLVIQDSPENPTAGISISTEATDIYTKYEPGRKIYFRVDGLYSGEFADLPTLGVRDGIEIGRMSIDEFNDRIVRSLETVELVPQEVTIEETLTDRSLLNTLIKLSGVEFADDELGEPYANLNNTFSVNRSLVNCDGDEIIVRNSGFADFKNLPLPEGNGMLTAVHSVFNGTYQLFIRDTDDVMLDGDRCAGGFFEETFEENNSIGDLIAAGWTNQNVDGGSVEWDVESFDDNYYAWISAFSSGETSDVWLVTPGIDMSNTSNEQLTFDVQTNFDNGEILSVWYSTDFSGNASTATWQQLVVDIPSGPSSGFGSFENVGLVDVSFIEGTVHFGFLYEGSDPDATTRYHVDNVEVLGN